MIKFRFYFFMPTPFLLPEPYLLLSTFSLLSLLSYQLSPLILLSHPSLTLSLSLSHSLFHSLSLFTPGIPHPNGSHLIISDDLKLLEEKLERRIPTGYIIINGRAQATQKFCEAVQRGKPVFVFKVNTTTITIIITITK